MERRYLAIVDNGHESMEVLRKNDNIIELANNDLVIQYDADAMEAAEKDEILTFSEVLFWLDTNIIGEEFCLSNWDMGIMLYNCYSDKCYIVSFTDLEKIKAGEKVTLHAYDPDEDDREAIEREYA